ncbi:MAG TPA: hypothetical protein VMR34_03700 [Candidatus Saccharimonadales bacterium]|nr:hypothetical protein [Candidatus Saccharimonadales bacterium]
MKTQLIEYVGSLLPQVKLTAGESFSWSPKDLEITYNTKLIDKPAGKWAFLHEAAHAKKQHSNYHSDLELLKLEVEAWHEASNMADSLGIKINNDHVQDCLDTYRDWLYRRSTCPNCSVVSLQVSPTLYSCHNCQTKWTVTVSRFCRPYRLSVKQPKQKRPLSKTTTFS